MTGISHCGPRGGVAGTMAGTTTFDPLDAAAPVGLTPLAGACAAGPGTGVTPLLGAAFESGAREGAMLYGAAVGDGRTDGSDSDAGAGGGMVEASGLTIVRKLPIPGNAAEP